MVDRLYSEICFFMSSCFTFKYASVLCFLSHLDVLRYSICFQWIEAYAMFQKALSIVKTDNKRIWGQFWSAHQRFFKYLCISAKVDYCVSLAKEALKAGKVGSISVAFSLILFYH